MSKALRGTTVLFLLITACTPLSLQGRWVYRDPVDHVTDIEITQISKNEIYLAADKNLLSGVYREDGDLLTVVKPDNPRAAGFKLRVVSKDQLLVVQEPPTSLTGQKHISGKLQRK